MNDDFTHRLTGHRGTLVSHPENSLSAFKAAIAAGFRWLECDLQLTKDQQPMVLHDDKLLRTTGLEGSIFDITQAQAREISVHYPDKFADKYHPEPMATLGELLALLQCHPDVKLMIELKQESIEHFSLEAFMAVVLAQSAVCKSQVVIISFNPDAVVAAKKAGFNSGWVIKAMNEEARQLSLELLPEYMITDVLQINQLTPEPELWQPDSGPRWQWMLYDVMDIERAKALMDKGVDLIETGDLSTMSRVS
jgi:glycerophosphoryl diester phosphodiesterase